MAELETGMTPADGASAGVRRMPAGLGSVAELSSFLTAERIPAFITAAFFVALFAQPFIDLAKDWWTMPEAGHGLLLAPVAVWLAWRSGAHAQAMAQRTLGASILVFAVVVRYAAALAAELYTTRLSIVIALVGLTVYYLGVR